MLVLIYRYNRDADVRVKTFDNYSGLNSFLFSPAVDPAYTLIDTNKLRGAGYIEKKRLLQAQAIAYSCDSGNDPLSYSEVATISNYFEKHGRRYGLLQELRENGLC